MAKTRFIIQKHQISAPSNRIHWDLRIQSPSGDLWSWAIPKAKMPEPGEKILAVRQPDHPGDYLEFRGSYKTKQGRKDFVEIVDRGQVDLLEVKEDRIFMDFEGKEIRGKYMLVDIRKRSDQDNWILISKR